MAAANLPSHPLDRLLEGLTADWLPDFPLNNIGLCLFKSVKLTSGNAVTKLAEHGEQMLHKLYNRVIDMNATIHLEYDLDKVLSYACGSYIETRDNTSNIRIFCELFISKLSDCAEALESLTESLLEEDQPTLGIVHFMIIATLHLTFLQEMHMISLLGTPNVQSLGYSASTKLMKKAAQHCTDLSTIYKRIQDRRKRLISGILVESTTLDSGYIETTAEFGDSMEGIAFASTRIGTRATLEADRWFTRDRIEKQHLKYIGDCLDKLNSALLNPEKVISMWRQLEETPPER